uniref:Uncharacterized protein n=1 Tax=Rangifer tarandus platyrhynchus TaxID=3082113 RepID=A0ACB0F8W2_RANTA|nr:unnamed protein product [Rangifer tarandus platyrhynchus]
MELDWEPAPSSLRVPRPRAPPPRRPGRPSPSPQPSGCGVHHSAARTPNRDERAGARRLRKPGMSRNWKKRWPRLPKRGALRRRGGALLERSAHCARAAVGVVPMELL